MKIQYQRRQITTITANELMEKLGIESDFIESITRYRGRTKEELKKGVYEIITHNKRTTKKVKGE